MRIRLIPDKQQADQTRFISIFVSLHLQRLGLMPFDVVGSRTV